jgi:hypothetical protein
MNKQIIPDKLSQMNAWMITAVDHTRGLRFRLNEQGFMQVGNYYSVRRQPLLIENIKLNLRTKV